MNASNDSLGLFQVKIQPFQLTPLEIEILSVLLQNGMLSLKELKSKLSSQYQRKGPVIPKALKKLREAGWLAKGVEDNKQGKQNFTYAIVSKAQFQRKLDEMIAKAQESFQNMKANYFELCELYQNFEHISSEVKTEKKASVTPKLPLFIVKWIEEIIVNFTWAIIKAEPNMCISLNKEGINFRLNSVEFQMIEEGKIYYGGINLEEFDSDVKEPTLLERIHQYNLDALQFNYKMEKKGFSETRSRGLSEYKIIPNTKLKGISGPCSSIEIKTQVFDAKGYITTSIASKNPKWIVSIWAETIDMHKKLLDRQKDLTFTKDD